MFRFIAREKAPIRTACRVLDVSESGYHAWRTRPKSERALGDEVLAAIISRIHTQSRSTYGAPRVHAELRLASGIRVGRKRVARLMREQGLVGRTADAGRAPRSGRMALCLRRTWSAATSGSTGPIGSGSPTSRTSAVTRASSTSRSSSTRAPAASWAGRCVARSRPRSSQAP
jgi:hypothetical protein